MRFSIALALLLASAPCGTAMGRTAKRKLVLEPGSSPVEAPETVHGTAEKSLNMDIADDAESVAAASAKPVPRTNPYKKKPAIGKKLWRKPAANPQYINKKNHDVWVEGLGGGTVSIRFSKHGNPEKAAYAHEFFVELRKEESALAKKYRDIGPFNAKFFKVCPLRSPDGRNCDMSTSPGSNYTYFHLVFFMPKDDDNTTEYRRVLAEIVTEDVNRIADQQFKFHARFEFAGDLTDPDNEDFLPPAARLLDLDVVNLMDRMYSPSEYGREQQSEELSWTFFGDRPDAPALIKNFPLPEYASEE